MQDWEIGHDMMTRELMHRCIGGVSASSTSLQEDVQQRQHEFNAMVVRAAEETGHTSDKAMEIAQATVLKQWLDDGRSITGLKLS